MDSKPTGGALPGCPNLTACDNSRAIWAQRAIRSAYAGSPADAARRRRVAISSRTRARDLTITSHTLATPLESWWVVKAERAIGQLRGYRLVCANASSSVSAAMLMD